MIKAVDISYSPSRPVYIVGVVNADTLMIADPTYYRSNGDGMALRCAERTDIVIPRHRIPLFDTPEKERING